MTDNEKRFIEKNVHCDVTELLLRPPKEFRIRIKFLANQIRSRQKVHKKLPSWFKNFDLVFPPALSVEQASSEITAQYKARFFRGELLVDLTGGMGIDTLALSRNFRKSVYVEQNKTLAAIFKQNCQQLNRTISVENTEASKFLKSFSGKASFFIDPSRRDSNNNKIFRFENCEPPVTSLLNFFEKSAAQVLIKASPIIDLKQGISEIKKVTEVHVVSIANECKEVLFLMDFEKKINTTVIKTINFSELKEAFDFTFSTENEIKVNLGMAGCFLLIPNVSILKAGAFNSIAQAFDICKIASNTHIYSSPKTVSNFPGKQFRIIEMNPSKNELKGRKMNIISRNHPMTASALAEKYKIQDGGEEYLIGFRDKDNRPILCICKMENLS